MKSDVISIYSDLTGRAEAIREAEKFSAYHKLDKRQTMHLRLLSEESVSMVHGILNGFKGDFWLESEQTDNGLLCRICVAADVDVDDCQEDALLEVSTSGKNEAAKGIMGKIRELFRWSMQAQGEQVEHNNMADIWFAMGNGMPQKFPQQDYYWSLQRYRSYVTENMESDAEEWDELEKSIVSKIADEVKVGIRSGRAEVIIEKIV